VGHSITSGSATLVTQSAEYKGKGVSKLLTSQNQTFASDTTDEFQGQINSLLVASAKALETSYLTAGDNVDVRPWRSERSGEVLHVWVPTGIAATQTAAMLILHLSARLDTVVLHSTAQPYQEPEWTGEVTRRFSGMIAALLGPPESFATSSSPIDLTRLALWISAIQTALSKPGGVKGAVGSVLPDKVGGSDSANKYLSKGFAAMRSCITSEDDQHMIKTIENLFKLWQKKVEGEALQLLTKNKISWGAVLQKGGNWETKKEKKKTIKRLQTPVKPNRSAFLSGRERTLYGSYYHSEWEQTEKLRSEWVKLTAPEQHQQYAKYVTEVTSAFTEMRRISASRHASLGHRKKWIEAACKQRGVAPSTKKDKTDLFKWSTAFFKLDLTTLHERVKVVFSPGHVLKNDETAAFTTQLYACNGTLTSEFVNDIETELDSDVVSLFAEWADRFAPVLHSGRYIQPADSTSVALNENPFSVLSLEEI